MVLAEDEAIIAFGSNMGCRAQSIINAIEMIKDLGEILAVSHLYESPPQYNTNQPPFLNGALKVSFSPCVASP